MEEAHKLQRINAVTLCTLPNIAAPILVMGLSLAMVLNAN